MNNLKRHGVIPRVHKKIVIVNTLYHPNVFGGAESSVQFLAESLVKAGIETVYSHAEYDKWWKKQLK